MGWLKLLRRKTRTFTQFSWKERFLLLQALVLLPLVTISLQLWGMRRTQSILTRLSHQAMSISSEEVIPQIGTTVRMVEMAVRYSVLWTNCLRKSLVLWYLLRCQGIVSELRIGVRREHGEFQAHAWVEYKSIVLNDSQYVRQEFAMFDRPIEVKGERNLWDFTL
jgi:hypothetical protein